MARWVSLVMGSVLLFITGALASEDALTKVYRVPRYEAEHVITDWLRKAGYEVRAEQDAQKVIITASKNMSAWEIVLRHDSPLATEVASGKAPRGMAEALWEFLSDYQQGTVPVISLSAGDVPEPVKVRMNSVVCIRAMVKGSPVQLSGFVVDTTGLILCTAHTLKNPTGISVMSADGQITEGKMVRIDFRRDLALIDCTYTFGNAVEVSNGRPVPVRDQRLFSIGCPRNRSGTVMMGIVSGPPRLVEGQPFLAVRMEIEPGSSGSPVFDDSGNLVGMVQGRMKKEHRSGLLIPVETIISFIRER
jgi:serine protease Do